MEFKNVKPIHDKDLLLEYIDEGEHVGQDFKYAISDSRKIARSISAFANNRGGRLLIGVKDNGAIAGVKSEEEFYMIEQAAQMYCKPPQRVGNSLYCFDGKYVLVADIAKSKDLVFTKEEGNRLKAYFRVDDENIQIPDAIAAIMRRRSQADAKTDFTETEAVVMRYANDNPGAEISDMALALKMSVNTITDTIIKLCQLGVLEFVYSRGKWTLSSPSNPDNSDFLR
ncbi:MAG: helix-turn-helix domain-containing protein [Candidatus Limisoma sp.]